ncbi:putative dehydrogenase [Haloactinopolyspora alba]|uniref:Putative dehydrogenase n=1 Tax=Haloactinopolyspora alba TaxID=648780 RepID=A0A2P8DZU7_9ACTN|nr:Gfo/Idh/MocA family oxidoreductase [Haloactinopolyspora alba]PSL02748.1 putative dehydrogenase [Haloactinopolyspora alba]
MAPVTDRMRVGVAGLGAVAQSVHLPLISRRWDLFELAAVCDLSSSLRDAVGGQYGVGPEQRYDDVDRMVAEAGVDGVLLLTSGSHGDAALNAISRGVGVFCEKPLSFTVEEADRLAAAEAALGRPALLLGYMKEYDEAVWRLRERLAGVGGVRAVDVTVLHPTGEAQLAFANLRPAPTDVDTTALGAVRSEQARLLDQALGGDVTERTRDLYANVVLGSLVHDTSLLRALFGGLVSVEDARTWPDDAYPPSVEVTGELPGSVRARMSWHFLPDYPAYRETLTVHHASGSLSVTFGTPYLLNSPTTLEIVESGSGGGELRSTYTSTGESFENELVDFHRMVTAGEAPRAGVAEGRADIVTSQRIIRVLGERHAEKLQGEAATA